MIFLIEIIFRAIRLSKIVKMLNIINIFIIFFDDISRLKLVS